MFCGKPIDYEPVSIHLLLLQRKCSICQELLFPTLSLEAGGLRGALEIEVYLVFATYQNMVQIQKKTKTK